MPSFFAGAPKGLEELLANELTALGAEQVKSTLAGVYFSASWEILYRVLLWSRLAGRVLLPLAPEFDASTQDDLYDGVKAVDWSQHLTAAHTLAVDAVVVRSKINHGKFAALKVKDAVVDSFREASGRRPSVDREQPDIRLNLLLRRDKATLSLDLSGGSLHQRGYRLQGGQAPLKENLAAAILIRAGWPEIAQSGGSLIDPMCGSATFLVEAAMMAADIAPGLFRTHFGVSGWRQFDAALWQQVRHDAEVREDAGLARGLPTILGFDENRSVLSRARENLRNAGMSAMIQVEARALNDWKKAGDWKPGLVIANPPYGERLGELPELTALYAELGHLLRGHFQGWRASVFTANPTLGKQMGIRAHKRYKFFNGALECDLLNFQLEAGRIIRREGRESLSLDSGTDVVLSEGAVMFRNRLQKNLKHLRKWVNREGLGCYRVYDADMPEYNVAIDRYGDHAVIQEYQAPADVDADKAEKRLHEVLLVAPDVLAVPRDQVVLKVRKRQKGRNQYEKLDRRESFVEVDEYGCRLLVNFRDYLDTGLFLDHRLVRKMIGASAAGKRFLNLFAYTGAGTVHAARGGAKATLTVDLSKTYLAWAERNMRLNGFDGSEHRYISADCLTWPETQTEQFDLIFLDPPTFSNSKRMRGAFDVQRDHLGLIKKVVKLLAEGGLLVFSTNCRTFDLDLEGLVALGLTARDITGQTIPKDFERNQRIHQCFLIERG